MGIKYIAISESTPGMILAKPVVDQQNRILCADKTKITEKLISRFIRLGVEAVYIETHETLSEEEFALAKSAIEERFQQIPKDHVLFELKDILLTQLQEKKNS